MKIEVVTKDNFNSLLPSILHHIKDAKFISFDTELTGLTMSSNSSYRFYDEIEERYRKLRDSALNFGLVQFGLCAWQWKSDSRKDGGKFVGTAWSFHLFPSPGVGGEYRRWTLQLSSIAFLRDNGFDFNKTFRDGISFLSRQEEAGLRAKESEKRSNDNNNTDVRLNEDDHLWLDETVATVQNWFDAGHENPLELPEYNSFQRLLLYQTLPKTFGINMVIRKTNENRLRLHMTTDEERQVAEEEARKEFERNVTDMVGFRRVIDQIIRWEKPLVGHNCWLDLMHFYCKFIGSFPSSWGEFQTSLASSLSTCTLADTKFIARRLISQDILHLDSNDTSLSALATKADDPQQWGIKIPCDGGKTRNAGKNSSNPSFHDAGFDAFCTGKVFVGLAALLARQETSSSLDETVRGILKQDSEYANRLFMMKSDYENIGVNLDPSSSQERPDRSHVLVVYDWPTNADLQVSHINAILKEAGLDRKNFTQHWQDSRTVLIELIETDGGISPELLSTIVGTKMMCLDGQGDISVRIATFSEWKENQEQRTNEEGNFPFKKKPRY